MSAPDTDVATACPACGAPAVAGDAFCEACGAALGPAAPDPAHPDGATPAADASAGTGTDAAGRCPACGGEIADDGFCSTCGAKAPTWRDHWTEQPAAWVGAVCDRGIRHARNEDALATAASAADPSVDPDAWAVLVVCDGVTSAPDSDQASLAAATDARDHLVAAIRSTRLAAGAAGIEAGARWMTAGCRIAQVAVLGVTDRLAAAAPGGTVPEPPSCTFVAGVVVGNRVVVGWCGDSRAYWLGDDGDRRQLGTDHSLAAQLIRDGASRAEAEADPTAHTITRWLGADSPSPTPDVVSFDASSPGWLLVCSDGLWNYASEPDHLAGLLATAAADGATGPVALAESLAAFANARGGHDNISVALARIGPAPAPTEPVPDPTEPATTQPTERT